MEGKLGLRPLAGGLGAEIIAYDFDSPPEEAVRSLQRELIDFHLLPFRGHALDPVRQLACTRLFGSTGRLGLYVTLGHGAAIVDEFGRENRAMRDALERHLGADGTYYRHRWQAGDTLVIDNFTVAHRAARGDAAPGVLHRTSIYGSTAWWRSGASLDFAGRALMAS
jgi:alpha-ketoglutarate-dependent taurine dioxygenase